MKIAGLLALALFIPAFAFATTLVNINTADAELLDTLPGIGPTYAERIIDYRTANGPFVRTEDIQNVSGIGPSTYADLASLITIGEPVPPESPASAVPAPPEGGVSTPPASLPSSLSVEVEGNRNAILEVPIRLFARTTTKGGAVDPARIVWSFGDGSSATGSAVEKTYRYAGTYLVTAMIVGGPTDARGESIITARPAEVRLLPVTGDGIMVMNDADARLDLSGWWLVSDKGSFRIPAGTTLLPKSGVLFPFAVIHLPVAFDVRLQYPNGVVAARSAEPAPAQPSSPAPSYEQVQKVEPIISTRANIQSHEEAVGAPATAVEPAAAGAVPTTPVGGTAAAADAPAAGLLRSPWTLGLLGVMVLAGAAFILL